MPVVREWSSSRIRSMDAAPRAVDHHHGQDVKD
jgi:hypothetical protein